MGARGWISLFASTTSPIFRGGSADLDGALEAIRKENGVFRAANDELLLMDLVHQVAPTWCSLDEDGKRCL